MNNFSIVVFLLASTAACSSESRSFGAGSSDLDAEVEAGAPETGVSGSAGVVGVGGSLVEEDGSAAVSGGVGGVGGSGGAGGFGGVGDAGDAHKTGGAPSTGGAGSDGGSAVSTGGTPAIVELCCKFSGVDTIYESCDVDDPWRCTGGQTYSCVQEDQCGVGSSCYKSTGPFGGTVEVCP
jgi:hypothetical protein